MGAGSKFSRNNHNILELNIQLQFKKNDTIEQLQMSVSTIATALAHTDL